MTVLSRFIAIAAVMSCTIKASCAEFTGLIGGHGYQVATQTELRMRDVVPQETDYSCAAASMASLVREKFGIPAEERPFFELVIAPLAGNHAALGEIEKHGMNVSHLMQMASAVGLHGQGVLRSLQGLLASEPLPVIARVTSESPDKPNHLVQHWVVVTGIAGNRVLIRDPVRGNRRMPAYVFAAAWMGTEKKGVLFRVEKDPSRFGQIPSHDSARASVNPVLRDALDHSHTNLNRE